jgi:hypothetical protein
MNSYDHGTNTAGTAIVNYLAAVVVNRESIEKVENND